MTKAFKELQFKVLIEQDEDGIFVASTPAIPGCHTQGDSYEEVIKNIKEAIELCLEEAKLDEKYDIIVFTMTNLVSISDARAKLPELVSRVSKHMGRVVITVNGQPKATLISAKELESLEETAEILAIPGAKEDIMEGLQQAKKGLGIPLSELK